MRCSVLLCLLWCQVDVHTQTDLCTNGDVRLEDGFSEYDGRIGICYDGEWGTVCDDGINDSVAKVVCRKLGLPLHNPKAVFEFGGGGSILLDGVWCDGSEANLLQCSHNGIKMHDCSPYERAGVSCALPCTESEVRLIINRVQICHNEVWGYVCEDNDWTDDDASVVCRELGFLPQGALGSFVIGHAYLTFPFLLSGPSCNGSEEHLIDCPLSRIKNITSCTYLSVVSCAELHPCNGTGALRLSPLSSDDDTVGRLDVCYNGYWGSVCGSSSNNMTANVACRQLGHGKGQIFIMDHFDHNILPLIPTLLEDVICTGNETSLLQCSHNGFNNHSCKHDEDVVLSCLDADHTTQYSSISTHSLPVASASITATLSTTSVHSLPVASPPIEPTNSTGRGVTPSLYISIVLSGIAVVLIAVTLVGIFVTVCLKKCKKRRKTIPDNILFNRQSSKIGGSLQTFNTASRSTNVDTNDMEDRVYDYILATGGSITTSPKEDFVMTGNVHVTSNPAYGVVNQQQ